MCTILTRTSPTEGSAFSIPVYIDFILYMLTLNTSLCVMRTNVLPFLSLLTARTEVRF